MVSVTVVLTHEVRASKDTAFMAASAGRRAIIISRPASRCFGRPGWR
jgi:hypothetical protein